LALQSATTTAPALAGAGNLTIYGDGASTGAFDTGVLNGSGVGYSGALTLRPTSAGTPVSMDLSDAASTITGVRIVDISDVGNSAVTVVFDSANNSAAYGASSPITVQQNLITGTTAAPTGALTLTSEGSAQTDALTIALGALTTGAGKLEAFGFETVLISSTRSVSSTTGLAQTVTLGEIDLFDGAGSQSLTISGNINLEFTAPSGSGAALNTNKVSADTVNTTGVTGLVGTAAVPLVLSQTSSGSSFQGGSGATAVTGTGLADSITTGIGNDTVDGGIGADIISSGVGNDSVTGGADADTITLGLGTDTLVFNQAPSADTITDYTVADDTIQLLKTSVYAALAGTGGVLAATEFESGATLTAAGTSAGRIVYNTSTGALYYDADGTGSTTPVLIGTFTNLPTLVATEFTVV
jgi:serralysin